MPGATELSPTDELWDDTRTAALLSVSRVTVRRLRRKGLLATVEVGAAARTPCSAGFLRERDRARPAELPTACSTPNRDARSPVTKSGW